MYWVRHRHKAGRVCPKPPNELPSIDSLQVHQQSGRSLWHSWLHPARNVEAGDMNHIQSRSGQYVISQSQSVCVIFRSRVKSVANWIPSAKISHLSVNPKPREKILPRVPRCSKAPIQSCPCFNFISISTCLSTSRPQDWCLVSSGWCLQYGSGAIRLHWGGYVEKWEH